jgi:hypothetical protein
MPKTRVARTDRLTAEERDEVRYRAARHRRRFTFTGWSRVGSGTELVHLLQEVSDERRRHDKAPDRRRDPW